jgi:hypothetical protein
MLFKKIFGGVERIFSEALVRWSEKDVGARRRVRFIVNAKPARRQAEKRFQQEERAREGREAMIEYKAEARAILGDVRLELSDPAAARVPLTGTPFWASHRKSLCHPDRLIALVFGIRAGQADVRQITIAEPHHLMTRTAARPPLGNAPL